MKVNHVAADVNGNGLRILCDLQPEAAIERNHRFRVLHWKRDMIETANGSGILDRNARRHRATYKFAPR